MIYGGVSVMLKRKSWKII